MAVSLPTDGINDRGNAERLVIAAETLIGELSRDLRVHAAYTSWLRAHDLDRRIRHLRIEETLDGVLAFGAALEAARCDLTTLERFVADDVRLPYRWLPPCLLVLFSCSAYSEAGGEAVTFTLRLPDALPLPRGRKPPRDGADIRRNVRWLYRAEVKQPTDSISALARQYRADVRRADQSRATVTTGIEQARCLLDLVVADWRPNFSLSRT